MKEYLQLDFGFDSKDEKPSSPKKNKRSKGQESGFMLDMMDVLRAPIVLPRTNWATVVPDTLKQNITMARLLSRIQHEKTATIPEVVAYLMPATFIAPLDHEWTNIYTWCSDKYLKEYENRDMGDIAPKELSESEKWELQRLRDFIYEKRREAVRKNIKEEERLKELRAKRKKGQDKNQDLDL